MSTLFGLNKPNTKLRKNVFDLSEKSLFTMSAGQLIPCMVKETNPGERFQMSVAALTRTKPLNTAGFVRCRQYFHFFHVPFKQLWNGWDNFINGVDYRTSALQKEPSLRVPAIDLFKVLWYLWDRGYLAPATLENADKVKILDEMGIPHYLGISRLLDMLGYGMHSSTGAETSYASLSEIVENLLYKVQMIDESKGTYKHVRGDQGYINAVKTLFESNYGKFMINPLRLLAYQKIYSDFYKRDDYESTSPGHFNIDDFVGTSVIDHTTPTLGANTDEARIKRLIGMLRLRYRWQPKDYFTGVVPSELFNVGSVSHSLTQSLASTMNIGLDIDAGDNEVSINVGSDPVVSTKTIRAAFAIERLLRLTRRAGGHDYISQIAAHYGFDVPRGRGDKVEFLGGFTNNVEITEVTATASTDDAVVGEIFGKGLGAINGGKDIEFTAKEHGLVMCICSIVPEVDYSADGMDRFNTKFDRGDYFHPEFQDLGLQPVYGYELKNFWSSAISGIRTIVAPPWIPLPAGGYHGINRKYDRDGNLNPRWVNESQTVYEFVRSSDAATLKNKILGLNPRYAEYKVSYDKLHGEFRNGRSLSAWSGSNMLSYNATGVLINTLKIDARCLNRVFSVAYDGRELNDQFMVASQFIIKAIRPMSITGQSL